MSRAGQNWKLEIKAMWVESAQLAGRWSAENKRSDPAWASLASQQSASITFSGDTLASRDRQTVTDGLRGSMQSYKTSLDLDENSGAGTGYVFTITVYREQTNAANNALINAEVTVAFSRSGRILCQTGPYYITETTEALTARRIAERLRGDQAFFNKVNEQITNNR
jgi:hypothetical protein